MSVEERALYEEMRMLADFDNYPIPESWYKEFNIPRQQVSTVQDFLKSGYTTRIAYQPKNLPPLIINKPQDNGRLVTIPDFVQPEVVTYTRPFDLGMNEDFPTVLPSLRTEEAVYQDGFLCQTQAPEAQEPESLAVNLSEKLDLSSVE